MTTPNKRITVYLDHDLHKALRLKSIAVSKSVSDLVNEAVRELLKKDRRKYHSILELMATPGLEVKPKPLR
ncbi:MAG: CopG family transcriptional regulator [Dehalococcoidales bacterium]